MVWKQRQEATPVIEKPAMELVSRSGWNQLEVQSGGVGSAKWLLGRLIEKSWGVEEGAVRQLSLAQKSPFPTDTYDEKGRSESHILINPR